MEAWTGVSTIQQRADYAELPLMREGWTPVFGVASMVSNYRTS